MSPPMPPPFRLGDWLVEPRRNRIRRNATVLALRPKTMELLVHLARRDGEVVSTENLHDKLWAGRYVTDSSIYNAIAQLREALGNASVETVPRRGYRLTLTSNWQPRTSAVSVHRRRWLGLAAIVAVISLSAGLWLAGSRESTRNDNAPPALVILPFNVMGDVNNELLAYGIHNELLTVLTGVGDLRVVAGPSVLALAHADDAEIAATVGNARVVRSELQLQDDELRLNVFLSDATNGDLLWAGQYDRGIEAGALFSLQSDIAARIATEMRAALSVRDENRLARVPTRSFAAWEAFTIGRRRSEERTVESLLAAVAYFRKAIALDKDYAEAHARLASSAFMLLDYGDRWNDAGLIAEARQAAITAVALAPLLAEAHKSVALMDAVQDNRQAAEASFRTALELAPGDPVLHHLYARILAGQGRFDDALSHGQRAVMLDPLSAILHNSLGMTYGALGRFDEAVMRFHKSLELDPSFVIAHSQLCNVFLDGLGRLDLAILSCLDMLALDPNSVFAMTRIADAYHDLGDHGEAQRWGARVFSMAPHRVSRQLIVEDDRAGFVAEYDRWREHEQPFVTDPFQIADYLCDAGRHDDARLLLAHFYPQWYEAETPRVIWRNDWEAVRIAFSLKHTGDERLADPLFEKVLDYQSGAQRNGLQGYGYLDILVLSALGRRAEAINAYEDLHRSNALFGFWRVRERLGPWADIADEPAFARRTLAIQQDLEAQLRSLRAALADRPSTPVPGEAGT